MNAKRAIKNDIMRILDMMRLFLHALLWLHMSDVSILNPSFMVSSGTGIVANLGMTPGAHAYIPQLTSWGG